MNSTKLKILIAEDTEMNVLLLKTFVKNLGHECIVAINGKEAIDKAMNEKPDMVLMDVIMPEMDGYEATRCIRQQLGQRWLPILFMSAKNTAEDQIAGLEAGGDDYLTKPVNFQILEAKINAMQRIAVMQQTIEQSSIVLQGYRDAAEEEKQLATNLMERMTQSEGLQDELLQSLVIPAEELSGDLVAAYRTIGEQLYVMSADATGHGLPAALSQLPVSQLFYEMAQAGHTIASIVEAMNTRLKQLTPTDRFVACILCSVDPRNKAIQVWNGASPRGLFINKQGKIIKEFHAAHPPLGILDKALFTSFTEIFLWDEPGELILCSDGLLDAENAQGKPLGDEGLVQAIEIDREGSCFDRIVSAVQTHLGGKRGHDDISVLVINCP